jgi:hypothetical protein
MSLCDVCSRIDPDLFSPAFDNAYFMQGPAVLHLPVGWIRKSALAGCPLCTCLIASADVDWLSRTILGTKQVILSRATIDPQQSLVLSLGTDDISRTYFFRVPPIWCKYILKRCLAHPSPNFTFCRASSARRARTAMSRCRSDVLLDKELHPKPSTVLKQCGEKFRADAPP